VFRFTFRSLKHYRSCPTLIPYEIPASLMHQFRLNALLCEWPRRCQAKINSFLYGNGRLDRWVRIVTDEFEIFEREVVDVFDGRVQFHLGQRSAIA